tara:strand:- start:113 stop:256 length:144 start_codon:yes stop_codon:yes gene_type:complete
MTVDTLMNWFAKLGDFPELAFILAVLICAVPVFLFIAVMLLWLFMGN